MKKGITLCCPKCAEREASISLWLADGEYFCGECEEYFTRADVESMLASAKKWTDIFAWADKMPTDE